MFKVVANVDPTRTKGLKFARWGKIILSQKKRENGVQKLQKKE